MGRPYAEVIGDPIAQSKSPTIHNFWLGKLGIDAEYRASHVRPDVLEEYLTLRRGDAEWRGCNVTMPHKQSVLSLLGAIDPLAKEVGAVNTIVRSENTLTGYNTDVAGVSEPLCAREKLAYPGHVATYAHIIGAGGAAAAAAVGYAEAGYHSLDIHFYNRTVEKARDLAGRFPGAPWFGMPMEDFGGTNLPSNGVQAYSAVVINASPLGMVGNPPLNVSLETFHHDTIVFDMVYSPLETPLLSEARRRGMRTIDGLEMLLGQAAGAFEKFFGANAPREHDAELRALLTA